MKRVREAIHNTPSKKKNDIQLFILEKGYDSLPRGVQTKIARASTPDEKVRIYLENKGLLNTNIIREYDSFMDISMIVGNPLMLQSVKDIVNKCVNTRNEHALLNIVYIVLMNKGFIFAAELHEFFPQFIPHLHELMGNDDISFKHSFPTHRDYVAYSRKNELASSIDNETISYLDMKRLAGYAYPHDLQADNYVRIITKMYSELEPTFTVNLYEDVIPKDRPDVIDDIRYRNKIIDDVIREYGLHTRNDQI